MTNIDLVKIREFADNAYKKANCSYDGHSYIFHPDMVAVQCLKFGWVFRNKSDIDIIHGGAYTHDLIEDAKLTYNNILAVCGKDIADVTLAVTDVPAETRFLRHLLTMPKTVRDYRAIILKLSDISANTTHSYKSGSGMFNKYRKEYEYRRPIFREALNMYTEYLYMDEVDTIFKYLDSINK